MTPTENAGADSGGYKQYRRSQIAELADWNEGFDMAGVSISDVDKAAGSPKPGDKIARNPSNHADKWLVAAAYFAANFEPAAGHCQPSAPPPEQVKKPRLFYWEDAEDCWCPADDLTIDDIITANSFFKDGDVEEIRFKRIDMTDEEYAALPEV